jgi:hypothetical protein
MTHLNGSRKGLVLSQKTAAFPSKATVFCLAVDGNAEQQQQRVINEQNQEH